MAVLVPGRGAQLNGPPEHVLLMAMVAPAEAVSKGGRGRGYSRSA